MPPACWMSLLVLLRVWMSAQITLSVYFTISRGLFAKMISASAPSSSMMTNPAPSASALTSTLESSMTTPSKRTRVSIGLRSSHPHPPGNLGGNHGNVISKSSQQEVGTGMGTSILGEKQGGEREVAGKPREGTNRRKSDRVYTYTPASDRRAALDSLKAQQEEKESEISRMNNG